MKEVMVLLTEDEIKALEKYREEQTYKRNQELVIEAFENVLALAKSLNVEIHKPSAQYVYAREAEVTEAKPCGRKDVLIFQSERGVDKAPRV